MVTKLWPIHSKNRNQNEVCKVRPHCQTRVRELSNSDRSRALLGCRHLCCLMLPQLLPTLAPVLAHQSQYHSTVYYAHCECTCGVRFFNKRQHEKTTDTQIQLPQKMNNPFKAIFFKFDFSVEHWKAYKVLSPSLPLNAAKICTYNSIDACASNLVLLHCLLCALRMHVWYKVFQ